MDLSRIAANSQRFRATVHGFANFGRVQVHSDSLRDSVMGTTCGSTHSPTNELEIIGGDRSSKIIDMQQTWNLVAAP